MGVDRPLGVWRERHEAPSRGMLESLHCLGPDVDLPRRLLVVSEECRAEPSLLVVLLAVVPVPALVTTPPCQSVRVPREWLG